MKPYRLEKREEHGPRAIDPDFKAGEAALRWAMNHGEAARVERAAALHVRRARWRACAAISTVLVLLGVSWVAFSPERPDTTAVAAASSGAGFVSSLQTRTLPDGSLVELNRGSEIEMEFTAEVRRIRLVRGEAYFSVAKDPARPFVVAAGDVEARAIGTAFAVQFGASKVEVLVTEGRVKVERESGLGATEERTALLEAGRRVVVELSDAGVSSQVEVVTQELLVERLAWRVPLLEFSGTPLSEVIPLFNRHAKIPLVFGNEQIRRLQLSGVLRADNVDLLLHLLEIEFGVRADRRSTEIILAK